MSIEAKKTKHVSVDPFNVTMFDRFLSVIIHNVWIMLALMKSRNEKVNNLSLSIKEEVLRP